MLVLPISAKWFDMILCGIKKEEYREIKPYYTSRFKTIGLLDRYGLPTVMKTSIILRNGYSSTSRQAIVEVSLDIKKGREEWGAILGQEYYCLRIENIHICREELMYMETRLHRAKSKQTNAWVKDNMLAVPELRMENGCMVDKEGHKYRIRKLTPTECFRLQDVSDEDIEKIRSYVDSETAIICDANGEPIMNMGFDKPSKTQRKITITVNGEQREYYSSQLIWKNKGKGISKTAQYKLAGNSICVAPMYHIFRKLFIEKECENEQLSLF